MSLFQKSVENKYLNELDTALVDNKYKDFQNYFGNPAIQENIINSKEEQFQEGFLRELFVSVFGYTLNPQPNFNLTTELKNIANSKKADGAILLTGEHAPPSVIAVIELKGTDTTDLDKIEAQAFGYKNHHPKCVYVITSNFEKLRFYIQNAVDHLDFDLFNLTRGQFSLLWLCLAKDNLLSGVPLKIKESSVLQEENITKKLYADYSKFREAIYNNLVLNNPETDKLLLFRKTQKLIDRFLFIFFAEDSLLVPPNSISQIIEKWKDDVDFGDARPLYHTFKKYFHVLNVGRPKSGNRQEIFAYNGGLFSEDEILDNINIDDSILYDHTLKLSQYNYETDVDVNILGHIFEHSLSSLQTMEHAPLSAPLSAPSIRKRDGIFYTPKYITKYIVENTVGKLCGEKRAALEIIDEEYAKGRKNRKKDTITALDKKLTDYRNWLLSLTILDPACGSGAFLNQALDFLITEHRKIDDLRAQLFGSGLVFSDITTDILEKNIYGVDINEESVEIAKLSLWLRTAQKGRKLNKLSNNIKCGNSLIDDPEVAGEKAFHWQKEFPEIFKKKEKKAWHITTATHNSRYSQRMFDSFVKLGEPVWLSEKEEIIVSETIAEIAEKDNLNILAYNICGDHAHILLVCEEEELPNIVQKIKSMSARACNIAMGRTIPTTEHAPSQMYAPLSGEPYPGTGTREHAPLSEEPDAGQNGEHAPRETRGKTQFHLWAQKFGNTPITATGQLENTIRYIENNRIKHGLDGNDGACSLVGSVSPGQNKGAGSLVDTPPVDTPPVDTPPVDTPSSGFSSSGSKLAVIAKRMTCTRQHAFRTEYKGGFDVVIGNPPYVQLQSMGEMSNTLQKCGYETFDKGADLYCLFTERAFKLLKAGGLQSFIMPNKWMLVAYGKPLRKFLAKTGLRQILNFGDIQFFAEATTYVCIFVTQNSLPSENLNVLSLNRKTYRGDFMTEVKSNIYEYPTSKFGEAEWSIQPFHDSVKLEQMKQNGIELKDLPVSICRGIITGFNEAFYIDEETRNKLVAADAKSAEIIKPMVRGRDISAYGITGFEYLIGTFPALKLDIDNYPAIKDHLLLFGYDRLNQTGEQGARKKTSGKWFETQDSINYYEEFSKPKIIYPNMTSVFPFMYDENGFFSNDKSFILTAKDDSISLLFLATVLNSSLAKLWIWYNCPELQGGTREIRKVYFEHFPVPKASEEQTALLANYTTERTRLTSDLQNVVAKFQRTLQRKFNIKEIPAKLADWYKLSYTIFIAELGKKKIKLSLADEAEWEDYFNGQKQKAQTLKSEIEKTDREIDRMVYGLYGLTEEEIKIVEDSM